MIIIIIDSNKGDECLVVDNFKHREFRTLTTALKTCVVFTY